MFARPPTALLVVSCFKPDILTLSIHIQVEINLLTIEYHIMCCHPGNLCPYPYFRSPLRNCFRPTDRRRDALSFHLSLQEPRITIHQTIPLTSRDEKASLIFARGAEIILGLSSVNAVAADDAAPYERDDPSLCPLLS